MARTIALALAGLLVVPAAQAAEVVGAETALEYSTFTSDMDDYNKLTARGSLELALSPELSFQGDLSLSQLGFIDDSAHAAGLHMIYNFSQFSLGAFVGKDWLDAGNTDFYGLEGATTLGAINAQAYMARIDQRDDDGTIFGAQGSFDATPDWSVGGRYDHARIDSADTYRLSLTTGYTMGNFKLTGELGRAEVSDSGSETFIGVGAKMTFGQNGGTTFGQRGLLSILPGL